MRWAVLPVAGRRVYARSKHAELTAKDALFVFLDRLRAGDAARLFKDRCVTAQRVRDYVLVGERRLSVSAIDTAAR